MEQQSAELVTQIGYFRSSVAVAYRPQAESKPRLVGETSQATKPASKPAARKAVPVASQAPLARASGDDTSWQEF